LQKVCGFIEYLITGLPEHLHLIFYSSHKNAKYRKIYKFKKKLKTRRLTVKFRRFLENQTVSL